MLLTELRVAQLGVIEDLTVVLGPGMTVLTGETGAGKTLIVDAIALLLGAGPTPPWCGPGRDEAVVEGRFVGTARRRGTGAAPDHPRIGPQPRLRRRPHGAAPQLADGANSWSTSTASTPTSRCSIPAAQRAALDASAGISTDEVTPGRGAPCGI